MSGEKEPPVRVDIGLGAKATLEARISTEIPAQSTGRLLDSLTDMIRPFSERRGLKADQIRLQREEVAVEIARKARQRLEIEQLSANPLPNKFLVPFLEKASLEELDSALIDRWADLLASCSADPASAHPRFVQLLSEMTGNDAALLRAIALNCKDEQPEADLFSCPFYYDPMHARRQFSNWFIENKPEKADEIYEYVEGMFGCPGVSLIDVPIWEIETDGFWSFSLDEANLPPAARGETAAIEILCSLQVISKNHLHVSNSRFDVDIYYVCITGLGIEFLMKCDHELEQKFRARSSR